MHSVRTTLSAIDTKMFKFFLEANDMKDIIVGSYDLRKNNFQVDHLLCYAYSDKDEMIVANMTYMTLKYGSVEDAFKHYMTTLRRAGGVYIL